MQLYKQCFLWSKVNESVNANRAALSSLLSEHQPSVLAACFAAPLQLWTGVQESAIEMLLSDKKWRVNKEVENCYLPY